MCVQPIVTLMYLDNRGKSNQALDDSVWTKIMDILVVV